jgi:type IV secretory pathway VirB3-like protein
MLLKLSTSPYTITGVSIDATKQVRALAMLIFLIIANYKCGSVTW